MAKEILQLDKFEIIVNGLRAATVQECNIPEIERAVFEFSNGTDRPVDKVVGKPKYGDLELKFVRYEDDKWLEKVILAGEKLVFTLRELNMKDKPAINRKMEGIAYKASYEQLIKTGDGGLQMPTLTVTITNYDVV